MALGARLAALKAALAKHGGAPDPADVAAKKAPRLTK